MLFFKVLHRLVHPLAGHRQKRLLQRQLHVRVGQGFFGLPQLAPQPGGFIDFISSFHTNDSTILATAILPDPPHDGVGPFDLVFALHPPSTVLAAFHLPDGLHFERVTVTNDSHDTWIFSFQSTNLFQDGTLTLNLQPSSFIIGFSYDTASRLQSVTSGDLSATYSYLANSALPEQIIFKQNGVTRMTTTKQFDFLNRLTGISSVPSASSVVSFAYLYNLANQRTNITLGPDNSRWAFSYDSLGQVTSGKKYWPDGLPFAGQQFEYSFDDIGNRVTTAAGGDQSGAGLRPARYTNNLLNQITSRAVPKSNDILGIAHASATVTVNGESPYRRGEYYRTELAATNAAGVAWQQVTNQAVLAGSTNQTTGNILTPPRAQQFWYDLDGNLLSDSVWTNTWDVENRLLRTVSRADTPSNAWQSLVFAYDPQGRRISKVVSNWTGSAWSKVTDQRFVYDDWNLIAILDAQTNVQQTFVWGLDLSGFAQGAGGVGGLLAVLTTTNGNHFTALDGNGNVAALISPTNGTETAHYEYGPFGELIRATGPMATSSPFRFSTKYQDSETDLVYYGYRYYSASIGRWLSKDPAGEEGGVGLYVLTGNSPVAHIDALGLRIFLEFRG